MCVWGGGGGVRARVSVHIKNIWIYVIGRIHPASRLAFIELICLFWVLFLLGFFFFFFLVFGFVCWFVVVVVVVVVVCGFVVVVLLLFFWGGRLSGKTNAKY